MGFFFAAGSNGEEKNGGKTLAGLPLHLYKLIHL